MNLPNNEYGDFQTPENLSNKCLKTLGLEPNSRVLEPTCGTGSFLKAAARIAPNSERKGVEINAAYANAASQYGVVQTADAFSYNFKSIHWENSGPLFVVGNPPWITVAQLKRMGSTNIPQKTNFKRSSGITALLGRSNFDISEFIILKMLNDFQDEGITLGMLCKTQVARNVIEYMAANNMPLADAAMYRIDAQKWFNATVEACWLILRNDVRTHGHSSYRCQDYADLSAATPTRSFGIINGKLVADCDAYAASSALDGRSPYTWRSGIKHDAAKVFELEANDNDTAISKTGDILPIKSNHVYPLMKSSDLASRKQRPSNKWVVVPQLRLGESTLLLKDSDPQIWNYLVRNRTVLDSRKSRIYKGKPPFSIFGVGEYTFLPYKVAISGLYKTPVFRLIGPRRNKPVIFDDTCYSLSFTTPEEAALSFACLTSEPVMLLIRALSFKDAKRSITQQLLNRIAFTKVVDNDTALISAQSAAEANNLPFDDAKATEILSKWQQQPALFNMAEGNSYKG